VLQIVRRRRQFPTVPSGSNRWSALRPVGTVNARRGPVARSPLRLYAFVTKGEANEGFRIVRRDCRGIVSRGLQRSPKHDVVNDAAELVEHVVDQPDEPPVIVVVIVSDGIVRPINTELLEYDSVAGRAIELRSIVERQRQPTALDHTEPRQGQGQVVID
jgi:hypothetical protein